MNKSPQRFGEYIRRVQASDGLRLQHRLDHREGYAKRAWTFSTWREPIEYQRWARLMQRPQLPFLRLIASPLQLKFPRSSLQAQSL